MSNFPYEIIKKYKDQIITVLACLFPLLPLLKFRQGYHTDWHNHLWMIGYTGEYFKQNLSFPNVYHSSGVVGYAMPIFYGTWFFPLAGVLSSVLGASLALRAILFLLFLVQFNSVKQLFEKIVSPHFSRLIACVVLWTVYTLTSIYNRCSIPELFATSLLLSAIAISLKYIYYDEKIKAVSMLFKVSLMLGLSFASHPITAVYGSFLYILVVFPCSYFSSGEKQSCKFFAGVLTLTGLLISPWLYLMLYFKDHVFVSNSIKDIHIHTELNSFLIRLIPVAYDVRSLFKGTGVEAPYLDAQINVPIFVLIIYLFVQTFKIIPFREREKTATYFYFYFFTAALFTLFLSVIPGMWNMVNVTAKVIQFPFRLISYINILFLLSFFYFLKSIPKFEENSKVFKSALLIALTMSFSLAFQKFTRAFAVASLENTNTHFMRDRTSLVSAPEALSLWDYSTPALYRQFQDTENFKLPVVLIQFVSGNGSEFGKTSSTSIDVTSPVNVQTNISAFPWNQIICNGTMLKSEDHFVFGNLVLGFKLPPGHYNLEYRFSPEGFWLFLLYFSRLLIFTAICYSVFTLVKTRLLKNNKFI